MPTSGFAESFLLLQQEGYLLHSCLTGGLTALRAARPDDNKGHYYSAFFQLSIGMERMMKLTFILRHMAEHGLRTPPVRGLRELGHDLVGLFGSVRSAEQVNEVRLQHVTPDSIEFALLRFLGDFAKSTRYYNLDSLAARVATTNPLAAYNAIFLRIVSEDIGHRVLQRLSRRSLGLARLMRGRTHVLGHNLDGQPMSLESVLMLPQLHDAASGHVVCRLYNLLRPLGLILEEAGDAAQMTNGQVSALAAVPYMADFLRFLDYDRRTVLRKRRWP